MSLRQFISGWVKCALLRKNRVLVSAKLPWVLPGHCERTIAQLNPGVLVDVGANQGQFAIRCRECGYRGQIVSFEPQPDAFEILGSLVAKDEKWRCFPFALGESATTEQMHVSAFSPSSSLLPIGNLHTELMPHTREVSTLEVDVKRLDDVIRDLNLNGTSIFLKMDVQGYEGKVMRGAFETCRAAVGVVAELNFAPLFQGQTKWYEVAKLLDDCGLRLTALVESNLHPNTGELLWADGLFLRKS